MAGILFFYVIVFWYAFYTFQNYKALKLDLPEKGTFKKMEFITVLIPFRNEALHLPKLIESLKNQIHSNFEVLLLNDHSIDNSIDIIVPLIKDDSRFCIVSLVSTTGKKAAIELGVQQSKAELICTTDADCILPENWIIELIRNFETESVQLVGAPVALLHGNIFERMQALEFASLIASTAGSAKNGRPILINAANMAFRKNLYLEVADSLNVPTTPSGDDIFLLQYCLKTYPDGYRFVFNSESLVSTQPESTFKSLINQRRRWASKSKYYVDTEIKKVSLLVFFTNLFAAYAFFQFLLSSYTFAWFFPLLLKGFVDYLILKKYLQGIQQSNLLNYFLLLEFLHPFYIIFVAISSQFGQFSWKERTYPT
jgi:cellulose synthase/poly-beta-1,6-N-acetylglucosamine synthase-like glycosyltransferase